LLLFRTHHVGWKLSTREKSNPPGFQFVVTQNKIQVKRQNGAAKNALGDTGRGERLIGVPPPGRPAGIHLKGKQTFDAWGSHSHVLQVVRRGSVGESCPTTTTTTLPLR
jgi:hypothetical protein